MPSCRRVSTRISGLCRLPPSQGKVGWERGQDAAASNPSPRGRTSLRSTSADEVRCTASRATVRDQLSGLLRSGT